MIMAGYEYMGEHAVPERLFHRHHPRQAGPQDVEEPRQFAGPARSHRQIRRRRLAFRRRCAARRWGRTCSSTRRTSNSAATSATSSGTRAASARCRAARCRARSIRRCSRSDDKWILHQARQRDPRSHRSARRIQIQRGGADALSFLLERVLRLVSRSEQGGAAGHGRSAQEQTRWR